MVLIMFDDFWPVLMVRWFVVASDTFRCFSCPLKAHVLLQLLAVKQSPQPVAHYRDKSSMAQSIVASRRRSLSSFSCLHRTFPRQQ